MSDFGDSIQPELVALSFGSNKAYVDLAWEALGGFQASYPQARCIVKDPSFLSSEIYAFAESNRRGYGYFRWKPYIALQTFMELTEGSVLIYIDARDSVLPGQNYWLDKLIEDPRLDMVAYQLQGFLEHAWTKADLLSMFHLPVDGQHASSNQYSANFFALRVNNKTRHFLEHWNGFMQAHYRLCSDVPSRLHNHPSFRENRYDQSVFSLLIKTLVPSEIRLYVIEEPAPVQVHAKRHPPLISNFFGSRFIATRIYQIRIRIFYLYWLFLLGVSKVNLCSRSRSADHKNPSRRAGRATTSFL
jgi:hypothetical protein